MNLVASMLCLMQFVLTANAYAGTYHNTVAEKEILQNFVENHKGTLICNATKDSIIYKKGITTYLTGVKGRRTFLLSALNNNKNEWLAKSVEMSLIRTEEGYAEFEGSTASGHPIQIEIGVGEYWRDYASSEGSSETSAENPYAAGAQYQFHNVCRIEL